MAWPQIWTNVTKWFSRSKDADEYAFVDLPEHSWKGVIKSWKDDAYNISSDAYKTILRNDVVMQPMTKFAERMSSMQLTVVGSGKRRDKLQEIVNRANGVGDMLYWLSFAKIEGVRFISHYAELDPETELYVPDFRGCGARKWKCGGNIYWEGWRADKEDPLKSIGKVEETPVGAEGDVPKEDSVGQWYNRADWTVFRPGAGTNPEGDIDHVLQLFLISESAQLLDKAMRIYADRYSLPRELLKEMIEHIRPDEMVGKLRNSVDKLARSNARRRMTIPAETVIELLEPQGTTWEFLTSYRQMLEARAQRFVWGTDMVSMAPSGGDRGGKEIGDKQEYSQLISFGAKIADALSNDWLPWIEKLVGEEAEGGELPRLRKGEPKPYLALRPPAEKQRLSVAELKVAVDSKIPINADDVYAILGLDRPADTEDVFKWENVQASPFGQEGDTPSNTGESKQRKDRPQKDSNMPPEKPQEDSNDKRNLPD